MIHIPGRIPITIHLTFWLFAGLIGFLISQSVLGIFVWVAIILVSVLFHEFGHALTACFFGQKPRIELVALGGLTYHDGQKLSIWKQFFIVLNGPLAGFLLFAIAALLLQVPALSQGFISYLLTLTRNVNLFWTVINLIPVMPLDGGQLLRIVLEGYFGVKGFRYSVIVSLLIAILISLFFFVFQNFLVGALFFLFAFQSFDMLRKTHHLSETDRDPSLRESLEKVEEYIQLGKKQEALSLCEKIREKAQSGMLFEAATQYLAFLKYEQGLAKEVYQLLCSIKSELKGEALCLLQKVAFEEADFALVAELAGSCFQTWPTTETALRNACAHAQLKQTAAAVGWLQTAFDEGLADLSQIVKDHLFDPVRHDAPFQAFLENLEKNSNP